MRFCWELLCLGGGALLLSWLGHMPTWVPPAATPATPATPPQQPSPAENPLGLLPCLTHRCVLRDFEPLALPGPVEDIIHARHGRRLRVSHCPQCVVALKASQAQPLSRCVQWTDDDDCVGDLLRTYRYHLLIGTVPVQLYGTRQYIFTYPSPVSILPIRSTINSTEGMYIVDKEKQYRSTCPAYE